ncbi:LOW QUALITY PROTEIN: hypothetical protein MXB_3331 [Myxobolus squamalis]|nr:LOW QUALITY PROTEIN: hypothetical protein MXB_3331 [Myxobolus squamalis]
MNALAAENQIYLKLIGSFSYECRSEKIKETNFSISKIRSFDPTQGNHFNLSLSTRQNLWEIKIIAICKIDKKLIVRKFAILFIKRSNSKTVGFYPNVVLQQHFNEYYKCSLEKNDTLTFYLKNEENCTSIVKLNEIEFYIDACRGIFIYDSEKLISCDKIISHSIFNISDIPIKYEYLIINLRPILPKKFWTLPLLISAVAIFIVFSILLVISMTIIKKKYRRRYSISKNYT